jgi:hypothetical protein
MTDHQTDKTLERNGVAHATTSDALIQFGATGTSPPRRAFRGSRGGGGSESSH